MEKLQEQTEETALLVEGFKEQLAASEKNFQARATEKTLAAYFEKIANSLQRECGERPTQSNLREKSLLGDLYQSEDSMLLARAVDLLASKIQIVGMNLIVQKKFKSTASHQLYELEGKAEKYITLDFFRKEHEELQRRIQEIVDLKLQKLTLSVKNYNDGLNEARENFESQVTEIKKETVWRIPELEGMVKNRITEQKAFTLVNELERKFDTEMKLKEDRMLERLYNSFKECSSKVDTAVEFTDDRYADTKRELMRLQSKVDNAVEKVKFAELNIEVKSMRKGFEEEIDAVQSYVRESRDKQTEMQIKVNQLFKEFDALKDEGTGVASNAMKAPILRLGARLGSGAAGLVVESGDGMDSPRTRSPARGKQVVIAGSGNVNGTPPSQFDALLAARAERPGNIALVEGRGTPERLEVTKKSFGENIPSPELTKGPLLLQAVSFREAAHEATRKGKQELIDFKICEFEENF